MKKRVMNIRPQEVTVGGERSVQYKGSDGKMHEVASAGGGGGSAPSPAIENNPNAYEIVATGEFRTGTATYKPVTPQAQCSTSRCSTPMVSLYTLIRFHYICPVQAARRKTSSCLTVGKPPCGRSPAVSRTRYYMVLRYAQKRLRRSRGKDTRTTLPPICGSFHSCFLLQSLPTPTSAYSGREV